MSRLLACWILLTSLASIGCAGIVRAPIPAPTNPLAYAIEAPDGGHATLFGSVHVGQKAPPPLPPTLAAALSSAELLVFEIDLSRITPDELAAIMLELGTLADGRRLRDVISGETWAAVAAHAKANGIDLAPLDRFEPWVVALHFAGLTFQSAGFESEHGVEESVRKDSAMKPIRGLETPHEQFDTFHSLPFPIQERMLLETVDPSAATDGAPDIAALVEAWRTGDGSMLEGILFADADDPEMAPFYQATYFDRNRRMAEGLRDILATQTNAFVVVGVAHLLGDQGIPALLVQRGFRVERLHAAP